MSALTQINPLAVITSSSVVSTVILTGFVLALPFLYLANFYFRYKRHQAATPWPVNGKVVVITGASSGIGEELAYEFARQGAKLILCARRVDKLSNVAQVCKDKYGAVDVTISKADVTRESDVVRLIETISATHDKIDCLVLNAGVSMGEALEKISDFSVIKDIMDVNYFGSTMFTYHALPLLKNAEKSRIVIVSSLSAIIPGVPYRSGYNASKYALKGFFESLQAELINDNIFITIAYPGVVKTEINQSRLGKNPISLDFSNAMSAEECSKIIVDGTIKGHKEIILTNMGRLGRIMEGIFPDLLFHLSYSRSKNYFSEEKEKVKDQ
ncbi:hypothetical protein C1645_714429 [Glomus cerebriforme]|uniref:Uncharacterized protein n=1 Tax=Glomus cerebriforme TaxID=658196 RepID=A0A397SPK1_9GLOM|nr:hypothetical protein C1645_714429 [Glomus cerebriforme]